MISKRSKFYLEQENISDKKFDTSKRVLDKTNDLEIKENQTSIINLPNIKPKLSDTCLSNSPNHNKEILNEKFVEIPLKDNEKTNNNDNNNTIKINNENNYITSNNSQCEIISKKNQILNEKIIEIDKKYNNGNPNNIKINDENNIITSNYPQCEIAQKKKTIKVV